MVKIVKILIRMQVKFFVYLRLNKATLTSRVASLKGNFLLIDLTDLRIDAIW